tara:strand:+ start:404 stop:892 length:489 start_codon:yes stop_codon:yes gene_type:complete
MTLKELKKMIAEEYAAFKRSKRLNEQPLPGDLPDIPGISVSDDDVDATGGGDAEGTLKKVFDILQDYFESGAEADDAGDDAGDDEAEDVEGEEDEEADIEEIANHGVGKSAKKTAGTNAGYKTVKESKRFLKRNNKRKLNEGVKKIQNTLLSNRFKKLANIK